MIKALEKDMKKQELLNMIDEALPDGSGEVNNCTPKLPASARTQAFCTDVLWCVAGVRQKASPGGEAAAQRLKGNANT